MKIRLNLKDHSPLIITLGTAYLYCCAYIFQIGWSFYFNLPISFILVDVTTLLQTAAIFLIISILVIFLYLITGAFTFWIRSYKPGLAMVIHLALVSWVLYNLPILTLGNAPLDLSQYVSNWIMLPFGIGIIVVTSFINKQNFLLLEKSYKTSSGKFLKLKRKLYARKIELGILKYIGSFPGILIPYSLIFILCQFSGHEVAKYHEKLFLGKTNYVLTAKYGDNYIFKLYDKKHQKFIDSLQISKVGDGNKVLLNP